MPRAASLDPPRIVTRSAGWQGGVNLRDALPQITPDEAKIMENGVLDQRGAFAKRLGCTYRGPFGGVGPGQAPRVLSLYTFYRAPAAPQVLMHTNTGELFYTNDVTADPIVWVKAMTGLSTTAPWSYETDRNKVWMGNGVDNYCMWDGGACTEIPSAPKGAYLKLWKDVMYMTGNPATPDRIYQANVDDPAVWPIAGFIDLGGGDGDIATGLGADGTNLIFFKRNRHWTIYDPVTLNNRLADAEKGCESHKSIIDFEGEILFLSRRGICRFFGDAPAEIISNKLDPLFDHEVLNFDRLHKTHAYTVGNQVGWAIPELGYNEPSVIIEYYPRLAGVTQFGNRGSGPFVFHRMPVGVFTTVRQGIIQHLYGGKQTDNRFLELFSHTGEDDGSPYVAILETGAFDMGQPSQTKYIRRIRFYGRGTVQCTVKRNLQTQSYRSFVLPLGMGFDEWSLADDWGEGTWGPDEAIKEHTINPDVYGRYFQFRFVDAMTAVGQKTLHVGSMGYVLAAGGWALHQYTIDSNVLGVRD